MGTEAALFRAIQADPDEDMPRLAYADWLDEHDQPERAELIRVQVRLAPLMDQVADDATKRLLARERELLDAHRATWTSDVGLFDPDKVFIDFVRGFPETLTVHGGTPADIEIVEALPGLRQLELEGCRLNPAALRVIAGLRQLDRLILSDTPFRAAWLKLLDPLPCWTYVRIWNQDRGFSQAAWNAAQERRIGKVSRLRPEARRRAAIRFLAAVNRATPRAGQPVTVTHLSQISAGDAELLLLSHIPELEEVHIFQGRETSAGLAHLTRLPKLKTVYLGRANAESLVPLMRCTTLEQLEYWPEHEVELGNDGLIGLERLTNLRKLALRAGGLDEGFGDATVRRLAPLRQLRSFDIQLGEPEDATSLAAFASLTKLEAITIDGWASDELLRHLAGLTNLAFLSVPGMNLTDAGLGHLTRLKKLRGLMAQSGFSLDDEHSAITEAGARALADQLPGVTIILDEHVVKSPRKTITFRRRIADDFASAVFPTHWFDDSRNSDRGKSVWLTEDGWENVGGWSSDVVGPCEIQLYTVEGERAESAADAMQTNVQNNSHLKPRVLKRDVAKLVGKDSASCIYRNDFGQSLVCAVASGKKCAVLQCSVRPARFAEFLPLFLHVAKSLRVGKAAEKSVGEEAEVAVAKL